MSVTFYTTNHFWHHYHFFHNQKFGLYLAGLTTRKIAGKSIKTIPAGQTFWSEIRKNWNIWYSFGRFGRSLSQ